MSKSLNDLLKDLDKLEAALIKAGPKIAQEVAQNAAALAIHRIQNEGIEGKSYSTKPMFATESNFNIKDRFEPTEIATQLGFDAAGEPVKGGVRTKKGTIKKSATKKRLLWIKFKGAKKATPVMLLPGGYKQLRQLNGLQTNHVDVTFSGRMIQNIKVLRQESKELKFLAIVGATQKEEKDKLKANATRYGYFLDPTPDEQKILQPIPFEIVKNIFDSIFKKSA